MKTPELNNLYNTKEKNPNYKGKGDLLWSKVPFPASNNLKDIPQEVDCLSFEPESDTKQIQQIADFIGFSGGIKTSVTGKSTLLYRSVRESRKVWKIDMSTVS